MSQRMTIAGAFEHLTETFDRAVRMHPDLMERYVTRLGDARDQAEQTEIMRCGLRETISERLPLPAVRRAAG